MTTHRSRTRRGESTGRALVEAVRKRTKNEGETKEVAGMVLPLASPMKRRTPAKRVGTVPGASGAAGSVDGKKNKAGETHDRSLGAGQVDEGGATETPATRQSKPDPMTSHPLKSIFAGLLSVYAMMRRRNKQITFSSIKDGVEQASRRRFGIADLRSLARMMPDILSLEEIRASSTARDRDDDVILRVNLPKGGAGVAMEAFATASERHVLVESTPMVASGGRSDGGCTANDVSGPGTSGMQTPEVKRRKVNPRIRSVLQSPTSRRLSDLVNGSDPTGVGAVASKFTPRSSVRTPMAPIEDNNELYSRTLSGVISMESLHQLEVNEQRHHALSSVEARASRRERAKIASLPDMLQRVMAVYGRKGPKVMALGAVCDKVRGGGLEMVSREEVEARVRGLADHAGEFLKIEKGRGGVEEVWVRVKGFDVCACMDRLKRLSTT